MQEQHLINTDPRETASEIAPHAKLPHQQRRRQRPWLMLALCALALGLSLAIVELTGGFSFVSISKSLPTRAFTINGHGSLIVNDDSGSIHIRASSINQVIIRGNEYAYGLVSDFNSTQVQYGQEGNTVMLNVKEGWNVLGGSGVNLTITVPAHLDVTVHSDSADTDLSNIDGTINTQTDSGNITVRNINGPLNLNSDSGDITVTSEQGAVSAHSDSGNIGFTGRLDPRGSYQMSTDSGNITLDLPANASFQLNTSTDSGNVNNAFAASTAGSVPHAALRLKTDSGNITLIVSN